MFLLLHKGYLLIILQKAMSRIFLIVNVNTFEIANIYTRDEPAPALYWEYPTDTFEHVELPANVNPAIIRVSKEKGKWMFYEDRAKKQAFQKQMFDQLLSDVRYKRNQLLKESDWIVSVPDAPFTDAQKKAWIAYRQKLRDITKKITAYDQVIQWPTPPT